MVVQDGGELELHRELEECHSHRPSDHFLSSESWSLPRSCGAEGSLLHKAEMPGERTRALKGSWANQPDVIAYDSLALRSMVLGLLGRHRPRAALVVVVDMVLLASVVPACTRLPVPAAALLV